MILDADVIIDLLRGLQPAKLWFSRLEHFPSVSGVALLEVLYGAPDAEGQRRIEKLVKPLSILWPNEADAQNARKLARYKLSDGIEMNDVLTAHIAMRHGLTLATFNIKHFRAIPGLSIMQPYARTSEPTLTDEQAAP